MGEIMTPIPFDKLIGWIQNEYSKSHSIFGIRRDKFFVGEDDVTGEIFGEKLSVPVGPAAGPHAQLAQNIGAAYLAGARFVELKTVQIIDGEELRKGVSRPCIRAVDECYNCEWSTELTVQQAFEEYVKGSVLLEVLAKEYGLAPEKDFVFNMSVGYNFDGITSPKIDRYIEEMRDASKTEIFRSCQKYLIDNIASFKNLTVKDVEAFDPRISNSITLSTLHGCPPDEIEKIARYLLKEKKMTTYVKCNPTLLGFERARKLLDDLGYGYIDFDTTHFEQDLKYADAIPMFKRLMADAEAESLPFGVKLTNTFPVKASRGELPAKFMYMSGRSIFPLSLTTAKLIAEEFDGKLPISYSGGADAFNVRELLETGIRPVTVATTLLKPGGYERFKQLAEIMQPYMKQNLGRIDVGKIVSLASQLNSMKTVRKEYRVVDGRKTDSPLELFDCFKSPCNSGGCAIEQQIPTYLDLVAQERYEEAFKVIAIDNPLPSITGEICDHKCQYKCTRTDYDESLAIRSAKKRAAGNAQKAYTAALTPPALRSDKKAVIIGAGPAGIAAAVYLRRNGLSATVLEKSDRPLGVVAHIIPGFRIADDLIENDYQMAVKMGVEFRFNVDPDFDIDALKKGYDFVIIAIGAEVEGRSGVTEGKELLRGSLTYLKESKMNGNTLPLGKRVAIIGAGDVAMDCSRVASRTKGVEEVMIVYRRTKEFMPVSPEELELGLADGVKIKELVSPVAYDGKNLKMEIMELGEAGADGRRKPVGTGRYEELPFDTVVSAVGAQVDSEFFSSKGLALNERGRLATNDAHETNIEDVYAAGDGRSGVATIVRAMAESKKVVLDILDKIGLKADFARETLLRGDDELYALKGILARCVDGAKDGERCLHCDQLCELCCDVCPNRANVAIRVDSPEFKNSRQILHVDGMCNECGNCGVFCPHSGDPYKDKATLFWSEEDFEESKNCGFLKLSGETYRIRNEKGDVCDLKMDDTRLSSRMRAVIEAVEKEYPYLDVNVR